MIQNHIYKKVKFIIINQILLNTTTNHLRLDPNLQIKET
jgi:hypothetical protein